MQRCGLVCAATAALTCLVAAGPRMAPVPILSGTPQNAHAYAAPATSQYVTDFPRPLVVRAASKSGHVRFSCAAAHCGLRVNDEANDPGKRVDAATYDEVAKNGIVTLQMGLATDLPGHYVVVAQAVDGDTVGPKSAPFELWAQ